MADNKYTASSIALVFHTQLNSKCVLLWKKAHFGNREAIIAEIHTHSKPNKNVYTYIHSNLRKYWTGVVVGLPQLTQLQWEVVLERLLLFQVATNLTGLHLPQPDT